MKMKQTLIASSILATLIDSGATHAALVTGVMGNGTWSTNHANFTALNQTGGTETGDNRVNMYWDGNAFNSSTDYAGPGNSHTNMTVSSTSPLISSTASMVFNGQQWTAHDIQLFVPGSYSFDTSLGGGSSEIGMLNVNVPNGQLGMHMLFDWNGLVNLDVFTVLAPNSMFGNGIVRNGTTASSCDYGSIKNCLWGRTSSRDYPTVMGQIWTLATVDGNGDGIMGIPMQPNSPLTNFNLSFNANLDFTPAPSSVPLPAAIWLFGSGFIGLSGVAIRRKPI